MRLHIFEGKDLFPFLTQKNLTKILKVEPEWS